MFPNVKDKGVASEGAGMKIGPSNLCVNRGRGRGGGGGGQSGEGKLSRCRLIHEEMEILHVSDMKQVSCFEHQHALPPVRREAVLGPEHNSVVR